MWPRENFSLQSQYNIKHRSDENKIKYQLGDYELIQYQILQIDIIRIAWQTVRRITNEILGVKGLTTHNDLRMCFNSFVILIVWYIFSFIFVLYYSYFQLCRLSIIQSKYPVQYPGVCIIQDDCNCFQYCWTCFVIIPKRVQI